MKINQSSFYHWIYLWMVDGKWMLNEKIRNNSVEEKKTNPEKINCN